MPVPETTRFQRYLSVISRWFLVLGLTFVFVKFSGNFIIHRVLAQKYTAVVRMQIRPHVDSRRQMTTTDANRPELADFLAEFAVIKGSTVLLPIIHDLDLGDKWAKRDNNPKEDSLTDEESLAYLNKILKVEFEPDHFTIDVSVTEVDPKEAADIANAVVDKYKASRDAEDDQRNQHGLAILYDQIDKQQKVVADLKTKTGNAQSAELKQEQSLLDALNVRLQQDNEDILLTQSPVRILSRAEVPTRPDRTTANLVATIVATILSIIAASFVEMILLFHRASERAGN